MIASAASPRTILKYRWDKGFLSLFSLLFLTSFLFVSPSFFLAFASTFFVFLSSFVFFWSALGRLKADGRDTFSSSGEDFSRTRRIGADINGANGEGMESNALSTQKTVYIQTEACISHHCRTVTCPRPHLSLRISLYLGGYLQFAAFRTCSQQFRIYSHHLLVHF